MSLISKQRINTNLSGTEYFFNSRNIKIFPCAYRGYWEEFTQHEKTENFHRDGITNSFTLTNSPIRIVSIIGTGEEGEVNYALVDNNITLENIPTEDADTEIQIKYIYLSTNTISQGFDPEAQATTEYNLTNLYGKLSSNKESYVISFTDIGNDKYLLKCIIGGYYFEINNVEVNDIKGKYLVIKLREFDLENSSNDVDRKSKLLESLIDNDYYLDTKITNDEYAFTGLAVVDTASSNYNYALNVLDANGNINWRANTILNALDTGSGKYSIQNLNENSAYNCDASGDYATALGTATTAKNTNAVALGNNTKTNMNEQVVLGKFNTESNDAYLVIGNGTSNSERKNVVEVKTDGTINTKGDLIANGSGRINTLTLGNTEASNSGAIDVYGNSTTKVFAVDNSGNTNISGTLTVKDDFEIGNDKFSVDSATGNTALKGTLDVNSNITTKGNITANKSGTNTLTLGSATSGSSGTIKIYGSGLNTNVDLTVNNSGNLDINGGIDTNGKITSRATTDTDTNTTLITKGYLESYVTESIKGKADSDSVSSSVDTLAGQISDAAKTAADNLSKAISDAKKEINQAIKDAKDALEDYVDAAQAAAEGKITSEFAAKAATATGGTSSGKYIIGVSQTNGQITAEEGTFSSSVVSTDTTNAPTGSAVYSHVNSVKDELEEKIESVWSDSIKAAVLDAVYPVGSIYTQHVSASAAAPAQCPIESSLGGTWALIDAGRFLRAVGDEDSTRGKTGGSANAVIVSHNHTGTTGDGKSTVTIASSLTDSNMDVRALAGKDKGRIIIGQSGNISQSDITYSNTATASGWDSRRDAHQRIKFALNHTHTATVSAHTHSVTINSNGEDGTGKNLPPYLNVYMWQRTE